MPQYKICLEMIVRTDKKFESIPGKYEEYIKDVLGDTLGRMDQRGDVNIILITKEEIKEFK